MRRGAFAFVGILFLVTVLFQNCGEPQSFYQIPFESTALNDPHDVGGPTPTPVVGTPTPVGATPTPNPTPVPVLQKTYFYYGANNRIVGIALDHTSGQFSVLTPANSGVGQAGWLSFDPVGNRIIAPSSGGASIQSFSFNRTTGNLIAGAVTGFFGQVVHLTMIPTVGGFDLFGSNYNGGSLGFYSANATVTTTTAIQSVSPGAMTHSSAYDARRNLLYVATLGTNRVIAYRRDPTGLVQVGSISVVAPRTLVYDSTYDKLYLATEASVGSSFVRAYAVSFVNNVFQATDLGSLAMPLSGGDLKVSRRHGYVMATARQAGQESVWGMPVTAAGVPDVSRPSFNFSVSQTSPRALEITDDGQYITVGSGAGTTNETIIGYRILYDSSSRFVSATKVFSRPETGSLLCGVSIPIY